MGLFHVGSLGSIAELLVAFRFVEAGRRPAWPLLVCSYDLIVDGGSAIFRVQVKQANRAATDNSWHVALTKKHKELKSANAYDYLCVVCDSNQVYVIPVVALHHPSVAGKLVASVSVYEKSPRFGTFLNRFSLGTGEERPITRLLEETTPRRFWRQVRTGAQRKPHKRLTKAQIEELLALPIRWFKHQPDAEGLIPVEQLAHQFDVSVVTLRNHWRRRRKDLADGVP